MIEFHYLVDPIGLPEKKVADWIKKIALQYSNKIGMINIVFCTNEYLLDYNRRFLNHDYYTDIITFPFAENPISGELYISVDQVKIQAIELGESFDKEILRVIIHGILHLLGLNDKTKSEQLEIREAENKSLELYYSKNKPEPHFYDQVYDLVKMIPSGRVSTYGALASFLSLGSARMVGWALNQLKGKRTEVPAQRVVNSKGILSGKNFFGPGEMEVLLNQEGVEVKNDKVVEFERLFWDPSTELDL
ncbi:MAG: rRNA maturation RNase YbeY [Saprospiraceae bacterium]|nr:rRNA maturation RNase YbeY [Saprospiraceae bacterium]